MNELKSYVVDIDDTLLKSKKIVCECCGRFKYELEEVYTEEVQALNRLAAKGHRIILWTGRGWDCYDITRKQLREAGVFFDELILGKPDGIYIDKDALKSVKEVESGNKTDS